MSHKGSEDRLQSNQSTSRDDVQTDRRTRVNDGVGAPECAVHKVTANMVARVLVHGVQNLLQALRFAGHEMHEEVTEERGICSRTYTHTRTYTHIHARIHAHAHAHARHCSFQNAPCGLALPLGRRRQAPLSSRQAARRVHRTLWRGKPKAASSRQTA